VTTAASCAAAVLLLAAPPVAGDLGLPAPFDRLDAAEVVRVSRLDGGPEPSVRFAAVSKAEPEPHLVAVLEAPGGGRLLSELALRDGRLSLVAQTIENASWDDVLGLDLAPYRLAEGRRAVGVRYQRMVLGGTGIFLVLYLRGGSGFERVFEEQVGYVPFDGDGEWAATVAVVPRTHGWNDLRVAVPGSSTAVGLRWNARARRYVFNG
jgi:hypothetical protein